MTATSRPVQTSYDDQGVINGLKRKREEDEADSERRTAPSPSTAAQEVRVPCLDQCWATEIYALLGALPFSRRFTGMVLPGSSVKSSTN